MTPSHSTINEAAVASGHAGSFQGRSTFIDALCGIAAIGVACHHITRIGYGTLQEPARELIPWRLVTLFVNASLGVQVFFVISGFVIAYSMRNVKVTPRFIANYALRRSIRLDPPLWTTILVVLILHWLFGRQFGFVSILDTPDPMDPPLTWMLVLSHLVYMQNILFDGSPNLSVGFWTLCIEVQFYLLYVMILGIIQGLDRYGGKSIGKESPALLLGLFGSLALVSLFYWHTYSSNDMWISHFFCMFYLGMSAWWAIDHRIPAWGFWGYVAAMLLAIVWNLPLSQPVGVWSLSDFPLDLITALLTGTAIYVLGMIGRLSNALNYRPLQFLGRISYSLYLIHFPVTYVLTTLADWWMHGQPTPLASLVWLIISLIASIVVANWMYWWIERPCVQYASSLRKHDVVGLKHDPSPSST